MIAPMHVIQMLGGPAERRSPLAEWPRTCEPGGRFAAAIVAGMPEDLEAAVPAAAGRP